MNNFNLKNCLDIPDPTPWRHEWSPPPTVQAEAGFNATFQLSFLCFQLKSDLSDATAHLRSLFMTQLQLVGVKIRAAENPERTQPTIQRC